MYNYIMLHAYSGLFGRMVVFLQCILLCIRIQGQATSDTTALAMTVEDCMRYAVVHSHSLRQQELRLDNSKATHLQAVGAFLPSLNASTSIQWNFGRAIDPETNTYTSVSTFNNGYGLSASLPVFDGLYRVHALRAARADVLLQKNALQANRDQVALQTYQAFIDVIYALESVHLATEKLRESEMILHRTKVMEEEGLKSPADVALIMAQQAADELMLTKQENQLESCMLKLKEVMNWPMDSPMPTLHPITLRTEPDGEASSSALLLQSFYSLQSARHNLHATRASLFPTLSLSAGINSSYYRNLNNPSATSFGQQLKNNLGEYVSINLSIPLFNRLGTMMSLRRAKNNLLIAEEQYAAKQTELDVLRRQAQLDVAAYCKESEQGEQKVAADSLAYELVRQQYTEGLASPIDLQTSSATLLQSRATLLQSRLMVGVKEMQRRYYNGHPLVEIGLKP